MNHPERFSDCGNAPECKNDAFDKPFCVFCTALHDVRGERDAALAALRKLVEALPTVALAALRKLVEALPTVGAYAVNRLEVERDGWADTVHLVEAERDEWKAKAEKAEALNREAAAMLGEIAHSVVGAPGYKWWPEYKALRKRLEKSK